MVPHLQAVKNPDTVHRPLERQVFLQASRKKTPMTLIAYDIALDSSNVAGRFGDHCPVDFSTKCGGIYIFYHRPRTPNDNPCQQNRVTLSFVNAGQIFNTAWNYFQNFRECCRHQHKALSILVKSGRHTIPAICLTYPSVLYYVQLHTWMKKLADSTLKHFLS